MNIEKLYAFAPRARVLENEPLARHTTFRVGGPADVLFLPESAEELQQAMELAREAGEDCLVIGNGSNLLVRDGGVRGLVIKLAGPMSGVSVEGTAIRAQAGASLSQVSRAALQASLTGLEFASGIPGSLGGALAMNAGAYGGELSQVVREAMVLMDGRVQSDAFARGAGDGLPNDAGAARGWLCCRPCLTSKRATRLRSPRRWTI